MNKKCVIKSTGDTLKISVSFENCTDEDLVKQIVKTKNAVLFGILFDRYGGMVYNKCYGFVKAREEAKDLAQDIFLNLFIKLGCFKGHSKFSTWLYAFTYNHCVNYIKRDISKKIKRKTISIDKCKQSFTDVDDSSLFTMKVEKLQKALEYICPEDKMILLLKYQDGFSIKELSEVLRIGESAVKMRLQRARAKIVVIYNNMNNE